MPDTKYQQRIMWCENYMTSCPCNINRKESPKSSAHSRRARQLVWLEPSPLHGPAQLCRPSPSPPRPDVTNTPPPQQGLLSTPSRAFLPLRTWPICNTDLVTSIRFTSVMLDGQAPQKQGLHAVYHFPSVGPYVK